MKLEDGFIRDCVQITPSNSLFNLVYTYIIFDATKLFLCIYICIKNNYFYRGMITWRFRIYFLFKNNLLSKS